MKQKIYIKKYFAILPLISILAFHGQSQLTLQNAIPIKSTTTGGINDYGRSIAYDQQGNYYVLGYLNGVSDFDPNTAGIQGPSSILNNGQAFLTKYNSSGAFQWYKMLSGGIGTYPEQITVSTNGVYVTHLIDDGNNNRKVTISKYDFAGNSVWSNMLNMTSTANRVNSLKTDANENVYIAGIFAGSNIDFDPGTGIASLSSTGGTYASGYVAKYNSTGTYQWAFTIAGNTTTDGSTYGTGMSNFKLAISGNNLFLTGRFVGSNIDFDPSSVTNSLSMNNTTLAPIFIAKYDVSQAPSSSTFFKWVFQPEGAFTSLTTSYSARFSMPAEIDVDGQGNIYTVGQFVLTSGAADFNPGTGQTTAMTTGTTMKVYVASYDGTLNPATAGFYRWGFTRAGSASNVTSSTSVLYNSNYIGTIATTSSGDFYLSGAFSGSGVDLNPLGTPVTISGGSVDIYLAKYNSNGICQWGNSFSTGSDGVSNAISSIVVDNENIYATGLYKSTSAGIDFDPGIGNTATTSFSTGSDAIVLKYSVCTPSSSTISETSCGSYTSPSGNNIWLNSGTYTDVISNQAGCDSTITINLTIIATNVGVTQTGNVLTANTAGATYQWVDCNNNYSAINGATNQSYAPTVNGSYAVIVNQGSCSDTSQCFVISTLGVNQLFDGQVEIEPNPAISQVMVKTINNPILEVFNAQGQKMNVPISKSSMNEFILEVGSLSSGVYYILIQNQDDSGTYKFLKQ